MWNKLPSPLRQWSPGIEDSPDPLLQFRMFVYRDAQYHRVGVNLNQVSVDCPFTPGLFPSLNFDGPLRVAANRAGNPQHAPNPHKHTFRPDMAGQPYAVANNMVSRKSHYYHEGKLSKYDQARKLYCW
jgi:catalase